METNSKHVAEIEFAGRVIHRPVQTPFYFVVIPKEWTSKIQHAAQLASYGRGVVPVQATVGGVAFRTSLISFGQSGYLLPLRATIRREGRVRLRDVVRARVSVKRVGTNGSVEPAR